MDVAPTLGKTSMEQLLPTLARLKWAIALVAALVAAALFRKGLQEGAAIVWFFALILVVPMQGRSP